MWGVGNSPTRKGELQFQATVLLTLQEVVEAISGKPFENANLCTVHAKCIRVMPIDIQLAYMIQVHMVK